MSVAAWPKLPPGMPPPPESFLARGFQSQVIAAAENAIAHHYRLPLGCVLDAMRVIERECEERVGVSRLGALLESPGGFAALGIDTAALLLGTEAATTAPPLNISRH
jgi:hypothetical protein